MTRSMLGAIAEAISEAEAQLSDGQGETKTNTKAGPLKSLAADIAACWESGAAARDGFNNFDGYRAWREHEHCRKTGISLAQLRAEKVDVSGYLATMPKPHGAITNSERDLVKSLAAQWESSADIRSEFRTFEVFAAYSRAKASGRARIIGG